MNLLVNKYSKKRWGKTAFSYCRISMIKIEDLREVETPFICIVCYQNEQFSNLNKIPALIYFFWYFFLAERICSLSGRGCPLDNRYCCDSNCPPGSFCVSGCHLAWHNPRGTHKSTCYSKNRPLVYCVVAGNRRCRRRPCPRHDG